MSNILREQFFLLPCNVGSIVRVHKIFIQASCNVILYPVSNERKKMRNILWDWDALTQMISEKLGQESTDDKKMLRAMLR